MVDFAFNQYVPWEKASFVYWCCSFSVWRSTLDCSLCLYRPHDVFLVPSDFLLPGSKGEIASATHKGRKT